MILRFVLYVHNWIQLSSTECVCFCVYSHVIVNARQVASKRKQNCYRSNMNNICDRGNESENWGILCYLFLEWSSISYDFHLSFGEKKPASIDKNNTN